MTPSGAPPARRRAHTLRIRQVNHVGMEAIENYPWFLSNGKTLELVIDDHSLHTQIAPTEWLAHWRPLLGRIHDLREQKPERIIIAVGAPPGAGKTVLAHQLAWLLTKGVIKDSRAIVLPMAGFYHPREYLESRRRKMENGVEIALKDLRGAPDTFDLAGFAAALRHLQHQTEELWWPTYSRHNHAIQTKGLRVSPRHNVVIVEGPYVLLGRGPLAGVPDLFDLRIYLEAPAASIIRWMVEQRVASGRVEALAKEYVKRIDLRHARLAEASKPAADVVVERSIDHLLIGVHFQQPRAETTSA
jgi:pantothenate kinase